MEHTFNLAEDILKASGKKYRIMLKMYDIGYTEGFNGSGVRDIESDFVFQADVLIEENWMPVLFRSKKVNKSPYPKVIKTHEDAFLRELRDIMSSQIKYALDCYAGKKFTKKEKMEILKNWDNGSYI